MFHKLSGIRTTPKFRRFVLIGTVALGVVYLLNLVLALFGIHLGVIETGSNAGLLSIIISVFGVGLAVFNFLTDIEDVTDLERSGVPRSEENRAAFGLVVTLIWMYIEILRILSYFRND